MDCLGCFYYDENEKCKLHDKLSSFDWHDWCDDYIDGSLRFVPNPQGCGIYNFPYPVPKENLRPDNKKDTS